MKAGKSIQELAAELDRQRRSRFDVVAHPRSLDFKTNGETIVGMQLKGESRSFGVNDWAHSQIATFVDVPRKYYDRLRTGDEQHRGLFDHTVNTLMHAQDKKRLVRTLDNKVRSMNSDKFQPFDNYELAESILPIVEGDGVTLMSSEVTDKRMYLKFVSKKVSFEVKKGDIVQAGLVVSNSEIGAGRLKVDPLIFRLACLNGMISEESAFRRNHAGRMLSGESGDGASEMFRDETRKLTDEAMFMQIRDVAQATLSDEGFTKIAERLRESVEEKIGVDAFEVVEVVQRRFGLNEREGKGVLQHLIEGKDMSRYGLVQAVTRYSQDVGDYDRATEFERLGGEILELPKGQWRQLAEGIA